MRLLESQLNDKLQQILQQIITSITSYQQSHHCKLFQPHLKLILHVLKNDYPELWFCEIIPFITQQTNIVTLLTFNYQSTDLIASAISLITEFTYHPSIPPLNFIKTLVLNSLNLTYESSETSTISSIQTKNTANCASAARFIQWILQANNFNSCIVYYKDGSHCVNSVEIDGKMTFFDYFLSMNNGFLGVEKGIVLEKFCGVLVVDLQEIGTELKMEIGKGKKGIMREFQVLKRFSSAEKEKIMELVRKKFRGDKKIDFEISQKEEWIYINIWIQQL